MLLFLIQYVGIYVVVNVYLIEPVIIVFTILYIMYYHMYCSEESII